MPPQEVRRGGLGAGGHGYGDRHPDAVLQAGPHLDGARHEQDVAAGKYLPCQPHEHVRGPRQRDGRLPDRELRGDPAGSDASPREGQVAARDGGHLHHRHQ